MGQTVIRFGDPKAVKIWSGRLFTETDKQSYFNKFEGTSENSIIQRKTDLESASGDRISFDLSVKLRGKPTAGDARVKGKEEQLKFFTDEVIIDQLRHAVSAGGKMTRKRTEHDLRTVAKDRLSEYWAKYIDELKFIYMSGARGMNEDFYEDLDYAGHAGNPLRQPDASHLLFGGSATSKATLAATDKMTRDVIERAANKARMMQARDPQTSSLVPVSVGSEKHYVLLMSPDQETDLRRSDTNGWLEIQKAAAGAAGNEVYKNAILEVRADVSAGGQMFSSMKATNRFPEMVIQMVSIGEESGSLDDMLARVANIYEQEVDDAVDGLTALLEPLIMSVLGVLIGGLIIAMYLPIFQLGAVIK